MSSNEIGLLTISELLGRTFFIPSYQRGYRWDKQQVEELLRDINTFATKKEKNDKEFYCLQPIVVRKFEKDNEEITKSLLSEFKNKEWYEVIDGQQRLTTIKILIIYLIMELYPGRTLYDEYEKRLFEILYQTRPDSNSFLNDIDKKNSDEYIDYYFISEAYNVICEFFKPPEIEDPQIAKKAILNTLIRRTNDPIQNGMVKVIWYETKDMPIDTFLRINMGKIPLTNAELIKALFLQERKFDTNPEFTKLRQIEIANEWDSIEYALQSEEFWWFLNKRKNETPSRIEFIFNLIFEVERQNNGNFDDKYGTDEYKVFRYFNDRFPDNVTYKKIKDEWDRIKDYYEAFSEWFNKPVWYHYIGFLIYCDTSVIYIYKIYKGIKKDDFTIALKNEIKNIFNSIKYEKNDKDNIYIPLPYDKSKKEMIRQFLLLFNIESIVAQYNKMMEQNNNNEDDIFIFKFPFKLFKKKNWDIEHISSFTPKQVKNKKEAKEWLDIAEMDFGDEEKFTQELKEKIRLFEDDKSDFDLSTFESIKEKIDKIAGEDDISEEEKNSIGNLTLLIDHINRKYGNCYFRTKRRIIIEEDENGEFIPVCTKNIFLKCFDREGGSRTKWRSKDITEYQNQIGKTLKDFLTPKEKNGENNDQV